jgi:hypothetical protein
MFDSATSPARNARELVSTVAPFLMLAVGLALLAPGVAWTAPAAAPASGASSPDARPGASCPVPQRPNAADGSLRGFIPFPNHYLQVDGKEVPSKIYHIDQEAMLVISSALPSPVLLKGVVVVSVPLAKIEKRPDGTLDVSRDAVLERLGPYDATYDSVTFQVFGHSDAVLVKPLGFLQGAGGAPQRRR